MYIANNLVNKPISKSTFEDTTLTEIFLQRKSQRKIAKPKDLTFSSDKNE
jgi:hypothetical protein